MISFPTNLLRLNLVLIQIIKQNEQFLKNYYCTNELNWSDRKWKLEIMFIGKV